MNTPTKFQSWMERELRVHYPTTTNAELADLLGVSKATIQRWASIMGLRKSPEWMCRINKRNAVIGRLTIASNPQCRRTNFHPPSEFKKGNIAANRRAVIRLDTMHVYPSISHAAREIGATIAGTRLGILRSRRCMGVPMEFLDDYNHRLERIKAKPKWQLTKQEKELLKQIAI